MGTTSTSGWAVLLFFLGFTLLGTLMVGGGIAVLLGIALIVVSIVLFQKAKLLEADK